MPKRRNDNPESRLKTTKREDSYKKLNESIFTRMRFDSWRDTNKTNLGKQKCKAVIIEDCPTLQEVVAALRDSSFINSLAEWEVFIVIISFSDPVFPNEEFLQEISDKVLDKPVLLQLNYGNEKTIFYKEENVKFKRLVLYEDEIEESSIVNHIKFRFLCSLLHSETNFGKFNFNLPETEIAMERSICGFRLIDWAVKHNNILCLKFLQMFSPNFESLNEISTRLLEVAAEFGTINSFKILIDTDIMEQSQKQILSLNSENEENLLMIAVKSGNLEIVTYLIECGLNLNILNINGETLSDIAWANYNKSLETSNNKNLGILIELLYNDAPFPRHFDKSQIKSKLHAVRFEMLIRGRQNLHDAISKGQLAEVKSFTENNKLKFAYDVNNQCALTTAIASKKFEIYSFLRSKGFYDGIDYKLDYYLRNLKGNEKENLRKSNLKYFKTNESQHIMDFVSKSRLEFGSHQKNFAEIQVFFESLDAIEKIRPILKIVASSDQTDIVFDFNRSSVEEMDPTGSRFVYGRTYETGNILIGASRKYEKKMLGTLAHELTHYAMQLVYDNRCLPFRIEDELREKEFEKIVETYDNQSYKSKNEIIARAFQKNYDLKRKMAELIVRVPHLMAMHWKEPEVLVGIREDFRLLFAFFEKKTFPDLKKEANLAKVKRDIRRTNTMFGVYLKAIQSNWLANEYFPSIDISKHIFVQSPMPDLVLESFVKSLQFGENEIDSRNIFVNLEQMFIKENFEMIKSAAESEALQKIFITEDSEKFKSEIAENAWKSLFNQCVIVFISNNKKSAFRNFFPSETDFNLNWSNLSDESKSKILKSKVIFQDQEVTLSEIVDDELLLQDAPLELLLEPSKLKLKSFSESLPEPPRVFIERTFKSNDKNSSKERKTESYDESDDYESDDYESDDDESDDESDFEKINAEDICDILRYYKKVLIADSAGMGKSTSAAQLSRKLKSQNQLSWVVFIDLKAHTEAFVRDGQSRTVTIDAKHFSQKLLKLQNKFEQKLFESFFEKRKVIFVGDGFDEISPIYKQFVMEVLKTIQSSGNQLLVTTRPHLVEELQKELNAPVFELMPFTKKDQNEFLTKYWQHTSIEKSKVEDLLEKFKLTWSSDFYSTPIHIFMLAEVFDGQGLTNLDDIKMNVFSLYKRFFTMKMKVWMCKGPLAQDENVELQQSSANLRQIIHKLALKQIFHAGGLEELNLSEITEEITNEMVLRVGIVSFGPNGTLEFTHRTFAEFFAADFVLMGFFGKTPQNAILNLFFTSLTNRNFETVRKFMNEGLCHFVKKMNIKALSRYVDRKILSFIPVDGKSSILSNLAFENHVNLVAFVLEVLILDTNAKIEIVKNILFKRIGDTEAFYVIWRCFENFEEGVQKNILFARNGDETILYRAVICYHLNKKDHGLIQFLEIAERLLNEEEFLKLILGEEGDDFQFYNHALKYYGVLSLIWEAAKRKLGTENLKNLATGKSKKGNTILFS